MRASRTRVQGVALFLAAGVVSVSAPAAMAGTAQLNGTSTQGLSYKAAGGDRNRVAVEYDNGTFSVADSAGVQAGPGCSGVDGTHAVCTVTASGGHGNASLSLRDGNDSARVSGVGAKIKGGSGRDRLKGGGHEDSLSGGSGGDRLDGGVAQDVLSGGSGNDRITARDSFVDRVSCGRGRDRARLDGLDYFSGGCEKVGRSDRAGATVLDLTTSATGGGTASVRLGCPRDAVLGCSGRVGIRPSGHSGFGNAKFKLRRPGKGTVRIALPADVASKLHSGGIRAVVVLRTHRGRLRRTVTVPQLLPGF
jgi:hypothetical protein